MAGAGDKTASLFRKKLRGKEDGSFDGRNGGASPSEGDRA
jgi:hypothetical protein